MSKIDLYKGDCLKVMETLEKESIDLIYIDPPFGIKQDEKFNMIAWRKTSHYKPIVYELFDRILNENDLKFLSFLYPRLKAMRDLLSDQGSIYVHIDWHVGHYVKILLDEIFGKENFLNNIVWCYGAGGSSKHKPFATKHDDIYVYRKKSNPVINILKHIETGSRIKDYWNIKSIADSSGYLKNNNSEDYIYNTQKPEALLERIIEASSNENSIIADFFGGSGTTIAVAKRLGRRGIYCDQNQEAYDIAKKRIEDTVVEKGLFDEMH